MNGIIAGGGLPEGRGLRKWLRWALRVIFPGRGGRV